MRMLAYSWEWKRSSRSPGRPPCLGEQKLISRPFQAPRLKAVDEGAGSQNLVSWALGGWEGQVKGVGLYLHASPTSGFQATNRSCERPYSSSII